MITQVINLPEKTAEDIAIEKVVEVFNAEALKQNSKFKLAVQYNFPHLEKPIFWKFGNSLGDHQVYWNSLTDEYSFIRGIDDETFNSIKTILDAIPLKFKIEIIGHEEETEKEEQNGEDKLEEKSV